jgi:peptidoglycan hydrolase-like protein with peptidoglycan-binding domain
MGILDDIESGLGLAPAPMAADAAPTFVSPSEALYSDVNGVDAAAPMFSAGEVAAQNLAQGPSTTPLATAPGWTTLNIQQDLNRLGALPKLVEDGKPGPKTTAALKAFQTSKGLKADGIVGAKTEAAITAALAGPVEPFVVPASAPATPAPAPKPAAAVDPLLGGKPPVKPAAKVPVVVAAAKATNVKAVLGVGVGVLGAIALAVKAHVFGR